MDDCPSPESQVRGIVVMGVMGTGKTTVGRALAEASGWTYLEGDAFHSPDSIRKMSRGIPLDDADRLPWLQRLGTELDLHRDGAVLACSALKASYRDILAGGRPDLRFVHLRSSPDRIRTRLSVRSGHYADERLLASQFEALEPPKDAFELEAFQPVETMVGRVLERFGVPPIGNLAPNPRSRH